jgi:5-methylcytosine-specific restriction endonuclease McrA
MNTFKLGNTSMRETEEWLGKSDSTPVPTRVRIRQYIRDDGRCQCGCSKRIMVGDKWETDHTIAIANGGENRENNLRTLLSAHHKLKTRADVAEKSVTARVRAKHLGLKKPRTIRSWRKFNGDIVYASRDRT